MNYTFILRNNIALSTTNIYEIKCEIIEIIYSNNLESGRESDLFSFCELCFQKYGFSDGVKNLLNK